MTIKFITALISGALLLIVLDLVRREKLTFKYAVGWICVAVTGLALTFFDFILFDVSRFLGFELPSNFIFFAVLSAFVFLCLLMTVFLCQQQKRNDIIAQKIGILQNELDAVKQNDNERRDTNE